MKTPILILMLLTLPAHAIEDDLFWKAGASQGQTVRSFFWQGKTYQNVRIKSYDGHNVVLTDGKTRFTVPDSSIPSLWRSALQRHEWPGRAKNQAPAKGSATSPAPPTARAAVKEPVTTTEQEPAQKHKTFREWETSRATAEARVRANAANHWKDDYTKQLSQVKMQMKAWNELYPRPGGAKDTPIPFHEEDRTTASYPPAEEPFRTRSVPLPRDPFTSDIIEIRIYNNKRAAARIPALAAAGNLAQATWPRPENADKREAEIKRLMDLWEETNFAIESP